MNSPMTTLAVVRLTTLRWAAEEYAEKRARAVSAAEPIAKPLPIAAVVLPRASRPSVISLTSSPSPDICEMPPALSATGP